MDKLAEAALSDQFSAGGKRGRPNLNPHTLQQLERRKKLEAVSGAPESRRASVSYVDGHSDQPATGDDGELSIDPRLPPSATADNNNESPAETHSPLFTKYRKVAPSGVGAGDKRPVFAMGDDHVGSMRHNRGPSDPTSRRHLGVSLTSTQAQQGLAPSSQTHTSMETGPSTATNQAPQLAAAASGLSALANTVHMGSLSSTMQRSIEHQHLQQPQTSLPPISPQGLTAQQLQVSQAAALSSTLQSLSQPFGVGQLQQLQNLLVMNAGFQMQQGAVPLMLPLVVPQQNQGHGNPGILGPLQGQAMQQQKRPKPRASGSIFKTVIECGKVDHTGKRQMQMYSSYFDKTVEIYTAVSDPQQRPLFRASALAEKFACATNKVGMYLARRRHFQDGIFQATAFRRKPAGRSGLKSGGYFLTLEACQAFEEHFKQQNKKRSKKRNKELGGTSSDASATSSGSSNISMASSTNDDVLDDEDDDDAMGMEDGDSEPPEMESPQSHSLALRQPIGQPLGLAPLGGGFGSGLAFPSTLNNNNNNSSNQRSQSDKGDTVIRIDEDNREGPLLPMSASNSPAHSREPSVSVVHSAQAQAQLAQLAKQLKANQALLGGGKSSGASGTSTPLENRGSRFSSPKGGNTPVHSAGPRRPPLAVVGTTITPGERLHPGAIHSRASSTSSQAGSVSLPAVRSTPQQAPAVLPVITSQQQQQQQQQPMQINPFASPLLATAQLPQLQLRQQLQSLHLYQQLQQLQAQQALVQMQALNQTPTATSVDLNLLARQLQTRAAMPVPMLQPLPVRPTQVSQQQQVQVQQQVQQQAAFAQQLAQVQAQAQAQAANLAATNKAMSSLSINSPQREEPTSPMNQAISPMSNSN